MLEEANEVGLQPYLQEEVTSLEAVKLASQPFKNFMLEQTREDDLALFMRIADVQYETPQDVSFWILMPAFVTSELKTAYEIMPSLVGSEMCIRDSPSPASSSCLPSCVRPLACRPRLRTRSFWGLSLIHI